MRKLFDIVAASLLIGWAIFHYHDAIAEQFVSTLEKISPPAKLSPRRAPEMPAPHRKIPVAAEDAIGAQRYKVRFQQGASFASNDCIPKSYLANADLVLLGAYEGGQFSPFEMISGSEHVTAKTIDVLAAPQGKDMFLIVSAYDPTIWNFEHFPTRRLKAVLIFGYDGQAVANLPKNIPARFHNEHTPYKPCGEEYYAYQGGPELDRLARNIERFAGKKIDRFNGAYDPSSLSADPQYSAKSPVESTDPAKWKMRGDWPMERRWLLPALAGLAQLEKAGAIRPATWKDTDSWYRQAAKAEGLSFNYYRQRPGFFLHDKAYVVSKPIEVPSGFWGLDAVDFIVEAGVPRPRTDGGHNDYYFIETGSHAP